MKYEEHINNLLKPKPNGSPRVLDLFAGAGGLSLGFEAAGFDVLGFEMDEDCCATYRANLHGCCQQQMLHPSTEFPAADVVIGGPPCQPFSVAGLQAGEDDARNGFPAFVSAVEQTRPSLFLAENVRGIFYKNRNYIESVCDQLRGLAYRVDVRLLNAVNYGVPQNRERVIIVGHRGGWRWPRELGERVTAGEALGPLALGSPADASYLTPNQDRYIANYEAKSKCVTPRDLHLHLPSRTLTCRNLAGATSDMMRVRLPDGRRRRLTVEEAARLQSFPDWWRWAGSKESVFKQIGNAVAPLFAYHLALAVRGALDGTADGAEPYHQLRLI